MADIERDEDGAYLGPECRAYHTSCGPNSECASDLTRLRQMLERSKIPYDIINHGKGAYSFSGSTESDEVVLTIEESKTGFGYSGFFVEFVFTKDGTLSKIGGFD